MSTSDFEDAFAGSDPPSGGQGGDKKSLQASHVMFWLFLSSIGLVLALFVASGQGGMVEIEDAQVAVIVNYLSAEKELVTQPGFKIFLPFLKQAFLFDKSPQKFLMEGNRDVNENHVSKLTVRANDGSNFWFEEIEIQYELIPDAATLVLSDSGPKDSFKVNWVRAYARSILRDEFGKFSAADVANPTVYKTATSVANERLNSLLNPHGVKIIQIITPKPKFDAGYEQAIEDRKVANQETERLMARAVQLVQERDRRLAQIDAAKGVEFAALLGSLEKERVGAEKNRVQVEKSADAYAMLEIASGQSHQAELEGRARGMSEKARKEAEGLEAIIKALEGKGQILVRERLAERLGDMDFTLIPYAKDMAPDRVEIEAGLLDQLGGGQ